ncbi:MAG: hypothetical protein LBL61_03190 [Elusimicrobiota bacterium]|jgi:hypothetical protein|nr:hypothetical protein [Elusimicrobiota bacterium]
MTPKAKLYLKITIIALLIAAGSALYHKHQIAKFSPPPPAEAAVEAAAEDVKPIEEALPDAPEEIPPADMPRGWAGVRKMEGPAVPDAQTASAPLDERLQAFNREMEAAVAAIPQGMMLYSNAEEIFLSNPQIQKILLKYSKDPAFMQLMEKMTVGDASGGAQKNAKQK